MSKIAYLALGSDYDQDLETNMDFVKQLEAAGDQVDIYSIDSNPVNAPSTQEHVHRYQMMVAEHTIDDLLQKIKNKSTLDLLIVMDGIHYLSSSFEKLIEEKIKEYNPSMKIVHFTLITSVYQNPVFNGHYGNDFYKQFNFKMLDLSKTGVDALVKSYSSRLWQNIVTNINIAKTSEDRINRINALLQSKGLSKIFGENQQQATTLISQEIKKQICAQIDLAKIGAESTNKPGNQYSSGG